MPIHIQKHARLAPEKGDGYRLLVTRYWLRGLKRDAISLWLKELAPSKALLAEYKEIGDNVQWRVKYREEMKDQQEAIDDLARRHFKGQTLTLLCACHSPVNCHRTILAELIEVATVLINDRA